MASAGERTDQRSGTRTYTGRSHKKRNGPSYLSLVTVQKQHVPRRIGKLRQQATSETRITESHPGGDSGPFGKLVRFVFALKQRTLHQHYRADWGSPKLSY